MCLFHIAKNNQWDDGLKSGFYGKFSIVKDGFIHCSTFDQLLHVANNNLKNIKEKLIILCIDTDKLKSEIKWEKNKNNGIIFPHVYGLINIDCVIEVIDFLKDENGDFFIPNELLKYSKYY